MPFLNNITFLRKHWTTKRILPPENVNTYLYTLHDSMLKASFPPAVFLLPNVGKPNTKCQLSFITNYFDK